MVSPIGEIHRYMDIFLIVQVLNDSIHLIPAMGTMPSGTMEQKRKKLWGNIQHRVLYRIVPCPAADHAQAGDIRCLLDNSFAGNTGFAGACDDAGAGAGGARGRTAHRYLGLHRIAGALGGVGINRRVDEPGTGSKPGFSNVRR
jgi:hypothetical protein